MLRPSAQRVLPLPKRSCLLLAILPWLALYPVGLHAGEQTRKATPSVKAGIAVPRETLSLNLRSAIKMALAKNYSIRVDQYGPAIADARVTQAEGRFDPSLVARGQRSQSDNPQLVATGDGTSEALTATRTVTETLDVSLQSLTPWGGVLSVSTSAENDYGDFNHSRDQYSSFVGVTATQPLLRDFGRAATYAPIRLARKDLQTSKWTFRQTVIDIITETAQAYNDLYFARENLGVAKRSRELADRLLKDNTKRVQLGVLTPLDISVARAQLAAREETIIVAKQTLREAENAFKLRVTDDVERLLAIPLDITPPEDRYPGPLDYSIDLAHAFAQRPDYQQAVTDIQRRQITLVFDQNQSRPRLDLSASLGSNGLDHHLGTSLAEAYQGENFAFSGGLNFTVPLFNREGRGRAEASRLDVARALVALKQLEQQIVVRLDNALGQVQTGKARITAAKEALRLAAESLAAEERKLTEGTSTTYVVLQLQNDYATAESTLLRASTDYQKALAEYERQAGRTLEHNHVELQM